MLETRCRQSELDLSSPAKKLLTISVLEPFETFTEKRSLSDLDSTTFSLPHPISFLARIS